MRTAVSLSVSPAGFKLESVAGFLLECPAGFIGIRSQEPQRLAQARVAGAIVLLSVGGLGTNAIMRETSKSKTCVWRWQERFATEGVARLLRDKTRPSRVAKFDPSIAERVVALSTEEPPGETDWIGAAMAKASISSVQRI
jgi:hypothetical protein